MERAECVTSRTVQRRYELFRKLDCSCAGNIAFNSLENLAAGQISFYLSVPEAIPSTAKSLVKVVTFSEGLKNTHSLACVCYCQYTQPKMHTFPGYAYSLDPMPLPLFTELPPGLPHHPICTQRCGVTLYSWSSPALL